MGTRTWDRHQATGWRVEDRHRTNGAWRHGLLRPERERGTAREQALVQRDKIVNPSLGGSLPKGRSPVKCARTGGCGGKEGTPRRRECAMSGGRGTWGRRGAGEDQDAFKEEEERRRESRRSRIRIGPRWGQWWRRGRAHNGPAPRVPPEGRSGSAELLT